MTDSQDPKLNQPEATQTGQTELEQVVNAPETASVEVAASNVPTTETEIDNAEIPAEVRAVLTELEGEPDEDAVLDAQEAAGDFDNSEESGEFDSLDDDGIEIETVDVIDIEANSEFTDEDGDIAIEELDDEEFVEVDAEGLVMLMDDLREMLEAQAKELRGLRREMRELRSDLSSQQRGSSAPREARTERTSPAPRNTGSRDSGGPRSFGEREDRRPRSDSRSFGGGYKGGDSRGGGYRGGENRGERRDFQRSSGGFDRNDRGGERRPRYDRGNERPSYDRRPREDFRGGGRDSGRDGGSDWNRGGRDERPSFRRDERPRDERSFGGSRGGRDSGGRGDWNRSGRDERPRSDRPRDERPRSDRAGRDWGDSKPSDTDTDTGSSSFRPRVRADRGWGNGNDES